MGRIDVLKQKVDFIYKEASANSDSWIDWGYPNHVLKVVHYAEQLAYRFKGNIEFVVAGALLHDIADAVMPRGGAEHQQKSEVMAKELLTDCEFSDAETAVIINDVIAPHSCREGAPEMVEGKILATADAMAHLLTDFYVVFCWRHYGAAGNDLSYKQYKEWVLKRLEKDFHRKIQFDEVRKETLPSYSALKQVFSQ